jgi:hypothetical protein
MSFTIMCVYIYIYFICHLWFNLGKDVVKGATKVRGHSFFKIVCLKNHKGIIIIWIVMKFFGLFFINSKVYMLKAWHKSQLLLHIQSIQTSRVDNPYFFQTSLFLSNMHHSFWKLKRIFKLMIRRAKRFELTIFF